MDRIAERVLALIGEGFSVKEAGKHVGINPRRAQRLVKRFRESR